jgi:hypothetical protein
LSAVYPWFLTLAAAAVVLERSITPSIMKFITLIIVVFAATLAFAVAQEEYVSVKDRLIQYREAKFDTPPVRIYGCWRRGNRAFRKELVVLTFLLCSLSVSLVFFFFIFTHSFLCVSLPIHSIQMFMFHKYRKAWKLFGNTTNVVSIVWKKC